MIKQILNTYKEYFSGYLFKNLIKRKGNILVFTAFLVVILVIFVFELPYPVIGFTLVSNYFLMLIIWFNAIVVWMYGEKTEIARFKPLTMEEISKNVHFSLFIQLIVNFFIGLTTILMSLVLIWVQNRNSAHLILFDRFIPGFNGTPQELAFIGITWYFFRLALVIIFMTLFAHWLIFTRGNFLKYSATVEHLPDASNLSPYLKAQITFFKRAFWNDSATYIFLSALFIIWGYPFIIIDLFTTNATLHAFLRPLVVIYLFPVAFFNQINSIEPCFDLGLLVIIIVLWKKIPQALKNLKPNQYELPVGLVNLIGRMLISSSNKIPTDEDILLTNSNQVLLINQGFEPQKYSLQNTWYIFKNFYRHQIFASFVDADILGHIFTILLILVLLYPLTILYDLVAVPFGIFELLFLNISITWVYGEKLNINRFKTISDENIARIITSSLKTQLLIISFFGCFFISLGIVLEWYAFGVVLELSSLAILWYFLRIILGTAFFLVFSHWLIFTHGNFIKYAIELKPEVAKYYPKGISYIRVKRHLLDRSGKVLLGIVSLSTIGYVFVLGVVYGAAFIPLEMFPLFLLYIFYRFFFVGQSWTANLAGQNGKPT